MIDWNHVDDLANQMGPDGMREIVEIFIEETDAIVAGLGGCDERLLDDLHAIKGSAANLGLRELSRLCRVGELAVRNGETCDVVALAECFSDSCTALERRIAVRA